MTTHFLALGTRFVAVALAGLMLAAGKDTLARQDLSPLWVERDGPQKS